MPAMRTMRISPMKASPVVVTLFSCDLALLSCGVTGEPDKLFPRIFSTTRKRPKTGVLVCERCYHSDFERVN